MSTEVRLPRLGESRGGILVRWLKSRGEPVAMGEALFEISADKIETTVPSPVSGRLAELVAHEGDVILIDAVVAVIDENGRESSMFDGVAKPLSALRSRIAERAAESWRTIPHAAAVFEVDVTRIAARMNGETGLPYFASAVLQVLPEFPEFNASVEEGSIRLHPHVNLGVAVAVPGGVIVPVIHHAELLSFASLTNAITDQAGRARAGRLSLNEMRGGTFSITGFGTSGSLASMPIIHPPQAAILGFGAVHERLAVRGGAMVVRSTCMLTFAFDHRAGDGSMAEQLLARVKDVLEAWEAS